MANKITGTIKTVSFSIQWRRSEEHMGPCSQEKEHGEVARAVKGSEKTGYILLPFLRPNDQANQTTRG